MAKASAASGPILHHYHRDSGLLDHLNYYEAEPSERAPRAAIGIILQILLQKEEYYMESFIKYFCATTLLFKINSQRGHFSNTSEIIPILFSIY